MVRRDCYDMQELLRVSTAFLNFYGTREPLLNGWFMLGLPRHAGTFTTCWDFDGMLGCYYVMLGCLSILRLLVLEKIIETVTKN